MSFWLRNGALVSERTETVHNVSRPFVQVLSTLHGGEDQIPYLVHTGRCATIYESDDIVEYLDEH